jgi:hypothetical protein
MLERVERLHYWSILIAQLVLLFIASVMWDHMIFRALFVVALVLVLGTIIRTIWESSLWRFLGIASALVAVGTGIAWHAVTGPGQFIHYIGNVSQEANLLISVSCGAYSLFILVAIIAIGRHVFITDRVTANIIAGGICLYMLIGMFFAFIFASIAVYDPSTFYMAGVEQSEVTLHDFFYFSYSTLTTTGFGDVVPLSPLSKIVANIEAIAGTFYIAIMIAGLASTYHRQRREKAA